LLEAELEDLSQEVAEAEVECAAVSLESLLEEDLFQSQL
jgi:hypothetical protein